MQDCFGGKVLGMVQRIHQRKEHRFALANERHWQQGGIAAEPRATPFNNKDLLHDYKKEGTAGCLNPRFPKVPGGAQIHFTGRPYRSGGQARRDWMPCPLFQGLDLGRLGGCFG